MAESGDATVHLNTWMNQQPVSFIGAILACFSPTKVRRRYARMALFKRFTVEELERRYEKEQARLSHKENQNIRQTIERFKRGWYIGVSTKHMMGTFYTPWSPFFTLLLYFTIPCVTCPTALFPLTTYLFMCFLRKDNHTICLAYTVALFFPLIILMDIIWFLMYIILASVVLLIFALLFEPLVFMVGMCWYRCGRLEEVGVFVYRCKLLLITAQGKASRTYTTSTGTKTRTVRLTKYDVGGDLILPRASLCRTIFCNPIVSIFENLDWSDYSYGEMADHLFLSAEEVKMYNQRRQECEALDDEAKLMV